MKKSFEVTAVVVTGNTYAPKMEDCKDYSYTVLADSPENAEESVRKMIEKDKSRFVPLEQRIRFLNVKRTDGGAVVYKDDDQVYRRFARALRKYRMWPYLERCKEACVDFCCYSGVDVEIAAAQFAKEQDVTRSIARDTRGDELTAMQQMRAEVIRQNGIRVQRAGQPVDIDKSAANNGPVYPDAGLERYHEMSPEVAKELARVNKPEQSIVVENESANKEENDMENAVANLVGTFENVDFYNFKEERTMSKKEMVKNSNAVLMNIIDKKTNEEKHLFAEVFHILHASDCYVDKSIDKPDTHVLVFHKEEGVLVTVESAVKFGREVYVEIGQLVDETNANAIRKQLAALFSSDKKENKAPEANPYQDLAAAPVERWTLPVDVTLQYLKPGEDKPRKFTVKRKITVVKLENKFYNGYVYHSNGQYLGHWYWNVKYHRPTFKPNQDIGDYNRINYEYAIRKALRTIGLYSEFMPESADRYAKKAI